MCAYIYIYIHRWLIVRLCSTEIASIRLGMFPSWRWTKDTIERWGERYYYRHYYSALCSRIAPFLRSKRVNFELGGKGGCYLWLARRHLTEGDRCVSRGIRRLLLMVDREMEKRWSPRIGLLFVEYVNGDELFDITRGVTHKEIHFSPSFDPDDLKKWEIQNRGERSSCSFSRVHKEVKRV